MSGSGAWPGLKQPEQQEVLLEEMTTATQGLMSVNTWPPLAQPSPPASVKADHNTDEDRRTSCQAANYQGLT